MKNERMPWPADYFGMKVLTPQSSLLAAMEVGEAVKVTAEHGTRARYQAGCLCDRCKKAELAYNRARNRKQYLVRKAKWVK